MDAYADYAAPFSTLFMKRDKAQFSIGLSGEDV
jgi:hypothetical protein